MKAGKVGNVDQSVYPYDAMDGDVIQVEFDQLYLPFGASEHRVA
jgi:hypothetical protein